MEIVKKYKYGREGNDCYINDYIYLIHIDSNLYVTRTQFVVVGQVILKLLQVKHLMIITRHWITMMI